jgi:hypothetical protein
MEDNPKHLLSIEIYRNVSKLVTDYYKNRSRTCCLVNQKTVTQVSVVVICSQLVSA